MNTPTASRKSTELLEPAHPVGQVRHLTEADLTEDERSRLFSCLDRGNRWFDRPSRRSSMRGLKHSPNARTRQDTVEPSKPT